MTKKCLNWLNDNIKNSPRLVYDLEDIKRNYFNFLKYFEKVKPYYAVKANPNKNILKLLDFKSSQTISMDEIEHHGLDPWVQWVSIHTGVPHKEHKITHLADISKLAFPQIWEKIGDLGLSSGIWGAMNASLNKAKGC